jgi:hypothetical protein
VSEPTLIERWASAEWRAEVAAWVDEHLASARMARSGELEPVRIRPWGTVLRASTSGGTVFMKATAPTTAFEAGLYVLLTGVAPARVLEPIAVDVAAGWLLLPDGGQVLSDQHRGEALIDRLTTVAYQYAQLQVALTAHVDDLLALGVADMRPERMRERFDEALAVASACAEAQREQDKAAALERVAGLRDVYGRWCERLADAPGQPTLDHNDLHGGNVFLTGPEGAPQARFFDWGDAVVAHPFASALVLRSVVRWILGVDTETAPERRILDAYLEPFDALASRDQLAELVDVACEVGKVARALVWARAVELLPPDADDPDEFASAPLDWMLELLDGPLAEPG